MTLVDAETGEVVERRAPRMPAPMTAVQVAEQCRSIEVWASQCDSIDEIREADNRLAAIAEYVKRTSTEGRAKVEAARRRLETRIGELIGPAEPTAGPGRGKASSTTDGLSRDQRSDFRKLADHPEIVDAVIDESDDETPASRRRVLDEINRAKQAPPEPETPEQRDQRERAEADLAALTPDDLESFALDEEARANKDHQARMDLVQGARCLRDQLREYRCHLVADLGRKLYQ